MQCDRFHEAISAWIDGEDPGLPDGALEAHLGVCADCRAWQQQAHALTRRARLGGPFLDRDLAFQVLAAAPAVATGRGRRFTQRAGLAAMAGARLLIWQARTNGGRSAGAFRTEAGIRPVTLTVVMPRRDAAAQVGGSPGFPGGEGTAGPVPGVSARTEERASSPEGNGDGTPPTGKGGSEAVA